MTDTLSIEVSDTQGGLVNGVPVIRRSRSSPGFSHSACGYGRA
jgi:hypothetical protein